MRRRTSTAYLEVPDERTLAAIDKVDFPSLRKRFYGAVVDQGYLGPQLEDLSLIPRVIPGAYMKLIEEGCKNLTRAIVSLANHDRSFILKHLKPDDRWRMLIDEYGILDRIPDRMIGEIRYDFALTGPLDANNPPQLMEVNSGALGLYAFASFVPKTVRELIPGLEHLEFYDVCERVAALCRRVGPQIASFFPGQLYWGDDLLEEALNGSPKLHLVSPVELSTSGCWPKLRHSPYRVGSHGRLELLLDDGWKQMDGFRWARVLTRGDVRDFGRLLGDIQNSTTTFMSPLRIEFVSHKGVMSLLCDEDFLKEKLGIENPAGVTKFVIPSRPLAECGLPKREDWPDFVLKRNYGSGGDSVYVGRKIGEVADRIAEPDNWIVQDRLRLNKMYTRFLFTNERAVQMDLGVFVHYDFKDGKFEHLSVAGVGARGSEDDLVNMTRGGAGVPVLWNPES